MKKFSLIFILLISLFGCSLLNEKPEHKVGEDYEVYYKAIEENDSFLFESSNYSINAEMVSLPSGKNIFYIFLDNPQIAMYDIKLLAIDLETTYRSSVTMAASLGIFEDDKYSLVPYQVNAQSGYYKGLMISGETTKDELDIGMLVSWYNIDRKISYREFIRFNLSLDGIIIPHDDISE